MPVGTQHPASTGRDADKAPTPGRGPWPRPPPTRRNAAVSKHKSQHPARGRIPIPAGIPPRPVFLPGSPPHHHYDAAAQGGHWRGIHRGCLQRVAVPPPPPRPPHKTTKAVVSVGGPITPRQFNRRPSSRPSPHAPRHATLPKMSHNDIRTTSQLSGSVRVKCGVRVSTGRRLCV